MIRIAREEPDADDAVGLYIRVKRGYKDFLGQLAERERTTVASLVDRAIACYSRDALGVEPPKR